MYRTSFLSISVLLILSAQNHALGEDTPKRATSENEVAASVSDTENRAARETDADAAAKVQFETGREFFNQGRYEEAAIAMKRAYELRPSYKILYYLGWAESETGNFSRALNAYNGYLDEAPSDAEGERIEEVRKEVEKLRARVGALQIYCDVSGAKIKIDNEVMGRTPLSRPISVDVGRHEVTVTDGTEVLLTEVFRIAGGQTISLTVDTTPPRSEGAATSAVAWAPPKPQSTPVPKKHNKGRVAAFAGFGLTAALGAAAAVTGALALQKSGEIADQCDADGNCYSEDYGGDFNADQSSLRTLGINTDVLIGIASAAAVASVVLLVTSRTKVKERASGGPVRTVELSPLGIFVSGRF